MPKFMMQVTYEAEGLRGLRKDGATTRANSVEAAVKALGGAMESAYFAFCDQDAVIIVDLPSNITAARLAWTMSSSGLVNTKITPLVTLEEADQALTERAPYKAPGATA